MAIFGSASLIVLPYLPNLSGATNPSTHAQMCAWLEMGPGLQLPAAQIASRESHEPLQEEGLSPDLTYMDLPVFVIPLLHAKPPKPMEQHSRATSLPCPTRTGRQPGPRHLGKSSADGLQRRTVVLRPQGSFGSGE